TLPNAPPTTVAATAGGALPEGCAGDAPSPTSAPVTFVAEGRAWATTPDGLRLWCLFEVRRPGPFLWGPRGDRVVLDGLEVRGVGTPVWRPARGIDTVSLAWLGANGNALAFVMPGGLNLTSAVLGSIDLRELTPFRGGSTYLAVAGHPSGEALAFVLRREGASEIWMASNAGSGAVRLVGPTRARLGPLAFSAGGKALYYGARQPDGSRRLEVFSLAEGRRLAPAWTGERDVLAVVSRRDPAATQIAVDTGSGCDDRRADLSGLDGGPGRPLLPSASRPTGAVGWVNTRQVLVVEGGCDGPFDLWLVDVNGGEPKPVARGIDRAALRWPDPRPAPAPPDLAALGRQGG
ncbi:MAG TPA: hypothetical protein VJ931_18025, partial [Actinomycetota bacterium]|nr:hypothetical protein [Actinomycetota bacterium]